MSNILPSTKQTFDCLCGLFVGQLSHPTNSGCVPECALYVCVCVPCTCEDMDMGKLQIFYDGPIKHIEFKSLHNKDNSWEKTQHKHTTKPLKPKLHLCKLNLLIQGTV